jgi:hypothetical protein
MHTLADLKRMLAWTNAHAFDGLTFDHAPIANELQALKAWIDGTASERPASDLILAALLRFQARLDLAGLREAKLVCYGCIEPFGPNRQRLIQDARAFPKLLNCVDEYRPKPHAFRRCYKGLLSGYFGYRPDGGSAQRKSEDNWRMLRTYLHDRLRDIHSPGIEPEWVGAITEHRNLLSIDPCSRYGLSLLEGDSRKFDELRRQLDISTASWVVTELVLGQIHSAVSQSDSKFIGYVPRLLALLEEHPLVLDHGLQGVLERYRNCADAPVNTRLRDFAVMHWGNPWLPSNSARWSRVNEPTRQMLSNWLKLDLIRQFFSLLAEDKANDKRRLKFWERYHTSIDDMYFALGNHARTNRSRDFVELRKKMTGRVLRLNSGGSPRNNAFIMRIGAYICVEFGVSGNACFIFRRRNLPFDLSRDAVQGDQSELKHDDHVKRLRHFDSTSSGPWERTFEQALQELIDVRPADRSTTTRSSISGASQTRGNKTTPETPLAGRVPYSRRELERFCANGRLAIRDYTPQRGNLWVLTNQSDRSVSQQLLHWGFQYKPNKGWWREKP